MSEKFPHGQPQDMEGSVSTAEHERDREYGFDEGKARLLQMITDRLAQQDVVVVAFHASGPHVGKTELASYLLNELARREGVLVKVSHDTYTLDNDFRRKPNQVAYDHRGVSHPLFSMKQVIIFDQQCIDHRIFDATSTDLMRQDYDRDVQRVFSNAGYEIPNIDLWVSLARPDKPFSGRRNVKPFGDIHIVNEKAHDK